MYINRIFELSMVLDGDNFQKALKRAYDKADHLDMNGKEYIDLSLESRGIIVAYRDSRYKKKIKVVINSGMLLDEDNPDMDKFVRKLDKRISEYFGFRYRVEDFSLSGVILSTDIDVCNHENVVAYLKALQRIGKVKGFSPSRNGCFDGIGSFCLDGNSNGIEFMIYDLEGLYRRQLNEDGTGRKRLKAMVKESEGILRTEIRLVKTKAVRVYADKGDIYRQIIELSEKRQDIFLDTFVRIITFGDYYKKDKAVEIIRSEVENIRMRRKMLRLMALIPEKKSLYLAQKAMDCRDIEKVMDAFAKINLSPVTISKRHDMKHLGNIYEYLFR